MLFDVFRDVGVMVFGWLVVYQLALDKEYRS